MASGKPVLYADFSGGVNLQAGPYLLSENECQDCRDVNANMAGALTKRPGCINVSLYKNSVPASVLNSAHTLQAVSGAFDGFIAVGPVYSGGTTDSIVKITPAGLTTSLTGSMSPNKPWCWVQGPVSTTGLQGPYYGMNGYDPPKYWDGVAAGTSNWTSSGPLPIPEDCPLLVYHLDKFWASGDPAYPGRIWGTGVETTTGLPDPRVWSNDYVDNVEPYDGQDITALGKVGPYLLVFKERKTYVNTDATSGSYRNISSTIGCSAHRSIVETDKGTMFLSEDMGVCVTDGTNITVISDKIKPLLDNLAETQPTALKRAAASFFRGSYYLSVPYADSKNTITLEFNTQTGAWWIHNLPYADFALLDNGGTLKLYGAKAGVAQMNTVIDAGVFTDAGVPYGSYWEGPYWTWGEPHLNKRITQFRVDGVGSWTISAATTFDDTRESLDGVPWEQSATDTSLFGPLSPGTFGPLDTGTFSPGSALTEYRYYTPTDGWGRAWSVKLNQTIGSAQEWQIHSINAFVRARAD